MVFGELFADSFDHIIYDPDIPEKIILLHLLDQMLAPEGPFQMGGQEEQQIEFT